MAKNSEGLFSVIASVIISIALISIIFPTIQISAHSQFPFTARISQISSGVNYKSSVIGKSETATTTALSMLGNKETKPSTTLSFKDSKSSGTLDSHLDPTKTFNNTNNNSNKIVILTFGDGLRNQYTNATPILDKYGFKASFFVTCNFVGLKSRMSWQDIGSLYHGGNDIGAKTMNYKILNKLSTADLNFEVGQSKKCLQDHGISDVTLFASPKGIGWDNETVINTIAKYYDFAINGFGNAMFLHCDGWKRYSSQTDCRTYFENGTLTYANRYSIREWTHNPAIYSYNDTKTFETFVREVNIPIIYKINTELTTNAIPVIAYHGIDNHKKTPYTTDVTLFAEEMKYLHDQGFRVIRVSDLGYNSKTSVLYINSATR